MDLAALMGVVGLLCSAITTTSIHLSMYDDALNANTARALKLQN